MPRNIAARHVRRPFKRVIRRGYVSEVDVVLASDFAWSDEISITAPGISLSSTFSTWTDSLTVDANVQLADALVWTDSIVIGGSIAVELSTAATWTDSLAVGGGISLSTSMTWADSISIVAPTVALTDSWTWTDSVDVAGSIAVELTDTWYWSDSISITDTDGLVANIDAYAINAMTGAASQYTWRFDSYMQIGSTHYAVNSAGLYTLGGDDDDGSNIDAEIRTGLLDFGTPQMKRTDKMIIGGTSAQELIGKVITHEGNDLVTYEYDAHRLGDSPSEFHVEPGKGMKSRYVQYGVCNQAGADFEIDRLDIFALALSRRR